MLNVLISNSRLPKYAFKCFCLSTNWELFLFIFGFYGTLSNKKGNNQRFINNWLEGPALPVGKNLKKKIEKKVADKWLKGVFTPFNTNFWMFEFHFEHELMFIYKVPEYHQLSWVHAVRLRTLSNWEWYLGDTGCLTKHDSMQDYLNVVLIFDIICCVYLST